MKVEVDPKLDRDPGMLSRGDHDTLHRLVTEFIHTNLDQLGNSPYIQPAGMYEGFERHLAEFQGSVYREHPQLFGEITLDYVNATISHISDENDKNPLISKVALIFIKNTVSGMINAQRYTNNYL